MAVRKKVFKTGTVCRYFQHMINMHGDRDNVKDFAIQQIQYVIAGVGSHMLGDDAIMLKDAMIDHKTRRR